MTFDEKIIKDLKEKAPHYYNYSKLTKVNNDIKGWLIDRQLHKNEFSLATAFENHIEEESELVVAISKRSVNELIDSICDKYVYALVNANKENVSDEARDILYAIMEVQTAHMIILGYDPFLSLEECVKHISCRRQDPAQKIEWEKNGPSGKWKKDPDQPDSEIYKPDYEKCFIK